MQCEILLRLVSAGLVCAAISCISQQCATPNSEILIDPLVTIQMFVVSVLHNMHTYMYLCFKHAKSLHKHETYTYVHMIRATYNSKSHPHIIAHL